MSDFRVGNHSKVSAMGTHRTNFFHFRCGSTDSIYGPVRNPWKYKFTKKATEPDDETTKSKRKKPRKEKATPAPVVKDDGDWYIAGGSSGGSAVSVATGVAFA